jgi:hypothetical protein
MIDPDQWPTTRAWRPLPGVGSHALNDWLDRGSSSAGIVPLHLFDDLIQPEVAGNRIEALCRLQDQLPGRLI